MIEPAPERTLPEEITALVRRWHTDRATVCGAGCLCGLRGDLDDLLTKALTREFYRRATERIEASPEEHCAGYAAAILPIVHAERRRALADLEAARGSGQGRGGDPFKQGVSVLAATTPGTGQATPLDCRSDAGTTVGLIDGILATARVLRGRRLSHPAVIEALADLAGDDDVAWLMKRQQGR